MRHVMAESGSPFELAGQVGPRGAARAWTPSGAVAALALCLCLGLPTGVCAYWGGPCDVVCPVLGAGLRANCVIAVPDSVAVTDVNVLVWFNLDTARKYRMDVHLRSPSGTRILLGHQTADYGNYDDEGTAEDLPLQSLAAFDGEQSRGHWTLQAAGELAPYPRLSGKWGEMMWELTLNTEGEETRPGTPDGVIHNGSAYVGDGIYNTTGAGQSHSHSVQMDARASYYMRFYNDGDGEWAAPFRITGPGGNAAWRVSYYDQRTGLDVTSAVTGSGLLTPNLAVGGYEHIRLEVTPLSGAPPATTFTAVVVATSMVGVARKDAVEAVTTCALTRRPDGMIHDGSAYIGDGVYNTTGTGQSHHHEVKIESRAAYYMRFYNDGNAADTFRIQGTGGNSGWRVLYYDQITGADLTAAVTGAGFVTSDLAPGSYQHIRLEVTPLSGVVPGAARSVLVTAASVGDPAKRDAVKTTTSALVWRPDAAIYDGVGYTGLGIHNTSGAGQTHSRTAAPGQTAHYAVRFYNDGNAAGKFRVTGRAGNSSWQVAYFEHSTGADITAAATGAGWTTRSLEVGQYAWVWVEVTPLARAAGNSVLSRTLTATSDRDARQSDTAKTLTTCTPAYRPDGTIYDGTAYVGDGIYNSSGSGQTCLQQVTPGGTAMYLARFHNDGNMAQSLRITGTSGNSKWTVRYVDHTTGHDITAAVTGTGWQTPILNQGGWLPVKVLITPGATTAAGAARNALITGTSAVDAAKSDAVKATAVCASYVQPDALIYNGAVYIGDGVYNSNGTGQTFAQAVSLGRTATYQVRFCNDGNTAQRLKTKGSPGSSKWTVRYVDYATGADITAAVTSAGWQTASLSPGAYVRLKVLVTPGASAAVGATASILVTATSTVDATKKDVVKASTTRK